MELIEPTFTQTKICCHEKSLRLIAILLSGLSAAFHMPPADAEPRLRYRNKRQQYPGMQQGSEEAEPE